MLGQELQTAIIANFIVALLAYGAGVLTSGKVLPLLRNVWAFVFNKEVQISIERRDIWTDIEEEVDVSRFASNLFHALRDHTSSDITNPDVNGRELTVSAEGIPNRISIKIDEEMSIRGATVDEESIGYRIAIAPQGDLRFGYRSDDSLQKFEKFSEEASEVVRTEFFPGRTPNESHIDASIKKGVPAVSGEVQDEELGISAHLDGSVLHMTMNDPSNLRRGIKEFLSPT